MNIRASVFRTVTTATGAAVMIFTLLPNGAGAQTPAGAPPTNPSTINAEGPNGEPWLPTGVKEVLKMHKGGISPDVLVHYIDNSQGPFHLSADGVIYLQQQGIPTKVLTELITRDSALQQQRAIAYQNGAYGQPPYGQPPPNGQQPPYGQPPPQGMVMPQTPPPVVNGDYGEAPPVVPAYPDYSYYDYGYPYYPYYGWGWPGGYWGWGGYYGRGWGGFRGGVGGFRGGIGGFHGGGAFHGSAVGGGFHGGGGGHGGGGHR